MFSTSQKHNPNYLAKIHVIENLRPHPNADRLQMTTIDGNNVIVGLNAQIGMVGIYFPLECKINPGYLSANNQYEDKTLNANPEVKGFFNNKGRVRAISLRSAKSEGFWTTIDTLHVWKPELNLDLLEHNLYFDTVGDDLFVEKYVPKTNPQALPRDKKVAKETSKMIEGQFRFHEDTEQLGRNLHKINDGDKIVVTQKLHGTSVCLSNLLCKRKLTWRDKIAKKLGVAVQETEYDSVYASRRVIKNSKMNMAHWYGTDIWGKVNEVVKPYLEAGITIYGEIVGYIEQQKMIQKGYDYGCKPGEWHFYVYRITSTNVDGKVTEFMWDQVKDYCTKYGLVYVPELEVYTIDSINHNTTRSDWPQVTVLPGDWRDNWMYDLDAKYLEKTLPNGMPDEGVCIRVEKGLSCDIFKRKSWNFLSKVETPMLDEEEENLEDSN